MKPGLAPRHGMSMRDESLAAALARTGGHAEALAEAVVVIVHHRLVQPLPLMAAHEHGHLVHRHLHITVLRLVQSQPQTGSASAIARDGDAKSRARFLRQDGAQLLARPVGDGHVILLVGPRPRSACLKMAIGELFHNINYFKASVSS